MRSVSPHQGGISFQNFSSFPHPYTPLFSLNQPPTHIRTTLVPQIYNVFDFVMKSLRERQQSRQSPIWPKHLHRLPLDCKTQKKFSCISPISPPSCLPERRISLFSFGFFFGHLILGSTSLGSVQNHMTFA